MIDTQAITDSKSVAADAAGHVARGGYTIERSQLGTIVRWIAGGDCWYGPHFVVFADRYVALLGDAGTMTLALSTNALDWVLRQDPEASSYWAGKIDEELRDHHLTFDADDWIRAVENDGDMSEYAAGELEWFRDNFADEGNAMEWATQVWALLDDEDGELHPVNFRRATDSAAFRFALIKLAAEATR